jgi:hypothetical protein
MLVREIGYGDGNLAGRCGRRVPARRAGGGVSELREDTAARDCAPAAARELPRPAEAPERPGGAEDVGHTRRDSDAEAFRHLGERAQGMTREEYADYMRALPAEEPGEPPEPSAAADLSFQRLGERAQGMTREEYADYMRQGPAAGGFDRVGAGWPRPGEGTIRDERGEVRVPAAGDAWGDPGRPADGDGADSAVQDAGSAAGGQTAQGDTGTKYQAGDTEPASPEQQRIQALEADNADLREQIAEASQKIANADRRIGELEAKNTEAGQRSADLEAKLAKLAVSNADHEAKSAGLAARMGRFEQLLAGPGKNPDAASLPERGDQPPASPDQQELQDAAIDEHRTSDTGITTMQAENQGWRRVPSAENLSRIGTFGTAVASLGEFAAHASPEGGVAATLAAIGVAAVFKGRAEKRAERKRKA